MKKYTGGGQIFELGGAHPCPKVFGTALVIDIGAGALTCVVIGHLLLLCFPCSCMCVSAATATGLNVSQEQRVQLLVPADNRVSVLMEGRWCHGSMNQTYNNR